MSTPAKNDNTNAGMARAIDLAPAYALIREVSERYVQRRIAQAFRDAGLEPPHNPLADIPAVDESAAGSGNAAPRAGGSS